MKKLKLNNYYVREEIHAIFSPDTDFSSGKGDWGGRGYASIPNRKGDYVFMASYGAKSKNIILRNALMRMEPLIGNLKSINVYIIK
jgi:hypothetical protein